VKRVAVARALKLVGCEFASVSLFHRVIITPGGGYTITLKIQPGANVDELIGKKMNLSTALNIEEIEIKRIAPRLVELTARPQMPKELPDFPLVIHSDIVPPRTPHLIPIGVDGDGLIASIPLFDSAGGSVSLVAGNPGSGKSSALQIIVASLIPTPTVVVWFDPKGGADAAKFSNRVDVVADSIEAKSAEAKLKQLNRIVMRRANALADGFDIGVLHHIVVLVDEWASLGIDGSKKEREAVEEQLRRLAATGRALKVSLVLATQRPTSTTIDVATRGLATTRLVFAVGDVHASVAALGSPGAETLHPMRDRGVAFLNDAVRMRKVRMFKVPIDLQAEAAANRGLKMTLDELEQWEMSCLLPG
jgi:hypothetical protein